jgi:hypothetical protein
MPFIGKKPAAAPLTSSDVADGIITNAKLAQDIISADTALGATPADTDEFLVSDAGVLKRMDYSHIKGGGSWTLIKTLTASSDATLSFVDGSASVVMDNTYRVYKWVFIDIHPATDDVHFQFQCSTNTGSSYGVNLKTVQGRNYHNGSAENWAIGSRSTSSGTGGGATGFESIGSECGNDNEQSICGQLELYAPSGTTHHKKVISKTLKEQANDMLDAQWMNGLFHSTSAIDAIQFKFSSGNIDSGQISMFGMV